MACAFSVSLCAVRAFSDYVQCLLSGLSAIHVVNLKSPRGPVRREEIDKEDAMNAGVGLECASHGEKFCLCLAG